MTRPTVRTDIDITALQLRARRTLDALDRNLRDGLKLAAVMVVDRAKQSRLFVGRSQGAGLRGSIRAQEPKGSVAAGDLSVDIVAGGLSEGVHYARYVEFGTDGPYTIRPKSRPARGGRGQPALAFPVRGRAGLLFRRSVTHPGNKPRPFLRTALEESADEIEQTMGTLIEASFIEGGF